MANSFRNAVYTLTLHTPPLPKPTIDVPSGFGRAYREGWYDAWTAALTALQNLLDDYPEEDILDYPEF